MCFGEEVSVIMREVGKGRRAVQRKGEVRRLTFSFREYETAEYLHNNGITMMIIFI